MMTTAVMATHELVAGWEYGSDNGNHSNTSGSSGCGNNDNDDSSDDDEDDNVQRT